jgi:Pyridine nucleotide-disulphide oxidoreductase, dimerisation domain
MGRWSASYRVRWAAKTLLPSGTPSVSAPNGFVPRARVASLPMRAVDRAVTAGQTEGFVKLIAGPRPGTGHLGGGRMLGAAIVASRAGEMINEVALAMRAGMFTGRLAQTTHAYPTWSLAIQQAAAQFFGGYGGRAARPPRPGDQKP